MERKEERDYVIISNIQYYDEAIKRDIIFSYAQFPPYRTLLLIGAM